MATFCHNVARNLPIAISDPAREIELVHVDDVVHAFISVLDGCLHVSEGKYCLASPTYRISLAALAGNIQGFSDGRVSLTLPDFGDPFMRALYSTYVSYLPTDSFTYTLTQRSDPRGELAELLKSPHIGQIFVSRTKPGITRGHHYHDTKVEKFIVLEGDAVIRFRHILGNDVIEYPVSGRDFLKEFAMLALKEFANFMTLKVANLATTYDRLLAENQPDDKLRLAGSRGLSSRRLIKTAAESLESGTAAPLGRLFEDLADQAPPGQKAAYFSQLLVEIETLGQTLTPAVTNLEAGRFLWQVLSETRQLLLERLSDTPAQVAPSFTADPQILDKKLQYLSYFVESSQVAQVGLDAQAKTQYVNPSFCSLYGYQLPLLHDWLGRGAAGCCSGRSESRSA